MLVSTPVIHYADKNHSTILNSIVCMNFARGMMAKERTDMMAIKYPMVENLLATELAW